MFQKRFEGINNVKVLKLKRKLGRFISKNYFLKKTLDIIFDKKLKKQEQRFKTENFDSYF